MASLLEQLQEQEESAKAANLKRYEQAMAIYDEIINRYKPGGEFGKATLGQLETQKVRDVGKETQQLISSGLYGTTTMGATGRRWEESVGAPARLKLEDIQMQRLSEAQIGKAGFIERREDIGPDYGQVAGLFAQAGQAPTTTKQRIPATGRSYQSLQDYMKSFSPAAGGQSVFGAVTTTPGTGRKQAGPTPPTPEAGVDTTPTERGQYGTYYGAAATQEQKPYIEGYNYAYQWKKKTGETLSQREAYAKLKGVGPK